MQTKAVTSRHGKKYGASKALRKQSNKGKENWTMAKLLWQSYCGKATVAKLLWQSYARNVYKEWIAIRQALLVLSQLCFGSRRANLGMPGDLVIQERLVALSRLSRHESSGKGLM